MTPGNLKVIHVMCGRHLERACSELPFHIRIKDDRNRDIHKRQGDGFLRQAVKSLVIRMHCNRGIAKHCFRTGRGHHQVTIARAERIADIVELAVRWFVLHLKIGKRGMTSGAPVDNIIALIDQSLVIETGKDLTDRARQSLVHCESFSIPITRRPQPFELVYNLTAGFLAPFPDPFYEFFSPDVMPFCSIFGKLTLHHVLGGDSGMVCSGKPKRVHSLHPPVPDQDVLEGVVQCMAHMQNACDIGRRNDYAE